MIQINQNEESFIFQLLIRLLTVKRLIAQSTIAIYRRSSINKNQNISKIQLMH